ncbi:MAG: methyltransferase domain-containing protein [Rhodospirillales bacterium]|nr:methyltransferase domain-containing protein [Rhodospirillales bacterium]
MSKPRLAPDARVELSLAALRPSEYTAALIQVLQAKSATVQGAKVLEIGSGSGVVLAALGELGAASLCGIDIEEDAVASGMLLLAELGHGETAELYLGDMWLPVTGRRFDLIVANLPHFPMERSDVPGRLPTWSAGGCNGRALLDPFLEGLDAHLAAGGRAIITHNAFVDLGRSREIVAACGMALNVALTTLVYIPEDKLSRMTASVLAVQDGRAIHRYGPYAFGDMHIVEITRHGAAG